MSEKVKIFRRKPPAAFEAIQFTDEPGNARDILKWTQNHGIASFYRAPIIPHLVKSDRRDGVATYTKGVPSAIGIMWDNEGSISWAGVGSWITYQPEGEPYRDGWNVMSDESFNEYYEEV